MTTPSIETIDYKIEALDRRLAGEHRENRDSLKEVREKQEAIGEKLDVVLEQQATQKQQIRTIERGGGGLLALAMGAIGTLFAEWVRRSAGGH